MYHSTRGIFLKLTPYSDTSAVVKVYTEEFGLQSYMVKGLRSRTSKLRPAFLQPLGILDMIVTRREKSDLQHIREARPALFYSSIPADIRKTSVVLFLNELLYKTLREESPNREMFTFIADSILELDRLPALPGHFHLLFALRLTRYLGFYPGGRYSTANSVFDLEGGTFIPAPAISGFGFISGDLCRNFDSLLEEQSTPARLPAAIRDELLDVILQYYSYHIPTAKDFKSHLVLREVLR